MAVQNDFSSLLALAQSGDPEAVAALVREYEPKVRIVARVLLGPSLRPYLDSLDVVQSVHKSLLIGLRDAKFDVSSPEKLVNFASVLVRRKIARHWRKLRRQQRLDDARDDGSSALADLLASATSTHTDPESEANYRDQVHHVFSHLDDADKQLLDLRLQGFSASEIADELKLTPVNVRVRLSRLRQKLQDRGVTTSLL